jgi:cell division transport system permease protein
MARRRSERRRGTSAPQRSPHAGPGAPRLLPRLRAWLEQQREVAIDSLGRLLQQPLGTLMTLAAVAIALSLPTALAVTLDNVKRLGGDWRHSAALSVFLEPAIDEVEAEQLRQQLLPRTEVEQVLLISRADGLTEFRDYSGLGAALDQLSDNPLPVVLELKLTPGALAPVQMDALIAQVQALPGVDFLRNDAQWAQRFQAITGLLRVAVALLGLLLGLAVLLIISNSIRLEVENHRDEIRIMGLVGATARFARRPFLYRGAWYGLLGGLLAALLVALMVWLLSAPAATIAALYHNEFQVQGLDASGLGLLLLASIGLGISGSWIAVARQLDLCEAR